MPTMNDYLKLLFVLLSFLFLIAFVVYHIMKVNVQRNWTKYRCNPYYFIFSKNIIKDIDICQKKNDVLGS